MAINSFPINTVPPTANIITSTPSGSVTATNVQTAINQLAGMVGGAPGGSNLQVQYNQSGSFGGYTGTQVTALLDQFTTALKGVVPASGSATGTKFLRDDNQWAVPPTGSGTPGGTNLQVQFNNSGVFGGYTNTQVTALLDTFSTITTTKGVVPGSNGATTSFLRGDGSWASPGTGSPGGSAGQVQFNSAGAFAGFTVGGDATLNTGTGALTIANDAVSYAKIQNVSATSRFLGRITAGAGDTEELTGTQATTLLDPFSTTTTTKGVVPGSNNAAITSFLRADGAWATPPGGSATPGGTNGQIQFNNAGVFAGFTMSGDATITTGGVITLNTVAATKGGTGQNAYVTGDILYASSTTTLARLASIATGNAVISGGVGTSPLWGKIGLATHVSGNLPVANLNNGTSATSTTFWAGDATWKAALIGVNPSIRGGYPTWSTTSGTILDGQGRINALAYGADPTGVADSKTPIQNALNTGKLVYLPTGKYTVSGALTISGSCSGLVGDGIAGDGSAAGGTLLQGNFASGDIVTVLDGVFFAIVRDMSIGRTTLGTSGSGVNVAGSAAGTTGCDGFYLHNLDVFNHNIGVTISGQTTQGHFHKCISAGNRSHGVVITGTILQAQLYDIYSLGNGGDGFHIVGTGAGPNPCGQWRGLGTASNTGFAFSATHVDGLRVADCFFGDNGIQVDVSSDSTVPQHFTNVYVECAAAGNNAWTITSNNISEVHLANCTGTAGGSGNGIVSAAPLTMITNGAFIARLGLGASTGSGIVITGARASIVASSSIAFGGTGSIVASGITACSIHACRTTGSSIINTSGTPSNVGNY